MTWRAKTAHQWLLMAGVSGILLAGCRTVQKPEYPIIPAPSSSRFELIALKDQAIVRRDVLGRVTTSRGGALRIVGDVPVESNSVVVIAGAQVDFDANLTAGALSNSTGTVIVTNGGILNVTNGTFGLGNDGTTNHGVGTGIAWIEATVNARAIHLGSSEGGLGLLTLRAPGRLNVRSNITLVSGPRGSAAGRARKEWEPKSNPPGSSLLATSSITIEGGSLIATNGTIRIGPRGRASMTIQGGNHVVRQIRLGGGTNDWGALFLQGGRLRILSRLVGNFIIVDGGDLDGSGGTIIIGEGHDAMMELDSGSSRAGFMYCGYSPGFTGTYLQNGGMSIVYTNMIVGDCINGAFGVSTLNGGSLSVTNPAHTAVLDIRNGTFTLNPGATLVVDHLVITNSCAHFMNLGGTLVENGARTLSPNLDADGDGVSNAAEISAGTDPLNPNSVFKMKGAVKTNSASIRVDWTTVGGHSYVVQTNGSLGGGTFHDLSPVIPVPGTGESTTNYVHTNGASGATRFYRVRLGP
jgi:hypothetical protein